MTNEQLVQQIQSGNRNKLTELWQQVERFTQQQARRYRGLADPEDLVQQGFLILLDAIADYEPGRCAFITLYGNYLKWKWGRWCITEGTLKLPANMAVLVRKYNRITQIYQRELNRDPSRWEAAAHLKVTQEELTRIQDSARRAKLTSLNMEIEGTGGDTVELQDLIPDGRDEYTSVLDNVQNEALAGELWPLVESLDEDQAAVILQRYKYNKSVRDTAAALNMTPGAAHAMEQKGFRYLRKKAKAKQLQSYLDEWTATKAIKGVSAFRFNETQTSATEREAIYRIIHDLE